MLWPKGQLFSPLGILEAFWPLKLSGFTGSPVEIGASGFFSYLDHFRLFILFICLDELA